jgi:soluble lytic murein transglycosylase-like protein
MKRKLTLLALSAAAIAAAPPARADYAVMKSGVRLHVTGYERQGDRMRLTVPGGVVDVAADDVVSIEPEDTFASPPPPPAASVLAAPEQFTQMIRAAAAKHGVDENLIARVIAVESNFNPRAVSRKQALGMMQLLPETALRYSVANVFDPAQNIDGGTHYLKDLLARYRGNLSLALAAYNAGPEMVERYGGVPPFPETLAYVRRITSSLAQEKNSSR